MGFCYVGRFLCCDVCGACGQTRKFKCPFGWCQAYALCPTCRAGKWNKKPFHLEKGCQRQSEAFALLEIQDATLLSEGKYLRRAALSHGERVKVIFRNREGHERAFFMSETTYHAFPYGTPQTIEDYAGAGELIECENADIYANA